MERSRDTTARIYSEMTAFMELMVRRKVTGRRAGFNSALC